MSESGEEKRQSTNHKRNNKERKTPTRTQKPKQPTNQKISSHLYFIFRVRFARGATKNEQEVKCTKRHSNTETNKYQTMFPKIRARGAREKRPWAKKRRNWRHAGGGGTKVATQCPCKQTYWKHEHWNEIHQEVANRRQNLKSNPNGKATHGEKWYQGPPKEPRRIRKKMRIRMRG